MHLPKINEIAPAFSLVNQEGAVISLADFRNKSNVVLYFYPKAMTPGCTIQARGIRDHKDQWQSIDTVVFGVSPDKFERLKKFEERDTLNFDLLSDVDHAVAEAYGVWGEKKFMGRTYIGVHRISFIIDKQGVLRHIIEKVKIKTHSDDIFDWITENI